MNTRIAALIALGALVAGCEPMGGMGMGGGAGGGTGAAGTASATGAATGSTVITPGETVPTDGPGDSSTVDAATGGSDDAETLDGFSG